MRAASSGVVVGRGVVAGVKVRVVDYDVATPYVRNQVNASVSDAAAGSATQRRHGASLVVVGVSEP